MNRDEELKRYQELMGREALERQSELAKKYCSLCGRRLDDHHPRCPRNRRK